MGAIFYFKNFPNKYVQTTCDMIILIHTNKQHLLKV
jgi:hypothetical protein